MALTVKGAIERAETFSFHTENSKCPKHGTEEFSIKLTKDEFRKMIEGRKACYGKDSWEEYTFKKMPRWELNEQQIANISNEDDRNGWGYIVFIWNPQIKHLSLSV